MNPSQSISLLVRALRPATRSSAIHRAIARPPVQRENPLWRPQRFSAPFTTSPTAIPPQSDAPADSSASPSPSTEVAQQSRYTQSQRPSEKAKKQPTYQLTFTCEPCKTRSSHEMSKQGYHKGTVLITCPECKNRHVISDHLKIFADQSITIEDIMRDKGEMVRRGSLTEGGDVEFWDSKGKTAATGEEGTASLGGL